LSCAVILESRLKEWGASFVGFCTLGNNGIPWAESLINAVSVGIHLSETVVDGIADKPTFTYFHHYRTVNTLIDQICLRGLLFIQENGYDAVAVPASQTVKDRTDNYSGIFPHKTAAVMSGLGWIGKSGLFISNKYGPRVRLGTILTNMPVPAADIKDKSIFEELSSSGCGDCRLCIENCPAMALTGAKWTLNSRRNDILDARACSEYMNSHFKHIGRGSVCGICMKVCPKGMTSR